MSDDERENFTEKTTTEELTSAIAKDIDPDEINPATKSAVSFTVGEFDRETNRDVAIKKAEQLDNWWDYFDWYREGDVVKTSSGTKKLEDIPICTNVGKDLNELKDDIFSLPPNSIQFIPVHSNTPKTFSPANKSALDIMSAQFGSDDMGIIGLNDAGKEFAKKRRELIKLDVCRGYDSEHGWYVNSCREENTMPDSVSKRCLTEAYPLTISDKHKSKIKNVEHKIKQTQFEERSNWYKKLPTIVKIGLES